MRVALAQYQPVLGEKAANLRLIEAGIGRAKKEGADLVVFAETFLTGYSNRDELVRLAETVDGPSVARIRAMAVKAGIHVIFGMPEKDAHRKGLMYNSSVLVTPDGKNGEVHVYRKWFLPTFGPFEEKYYYTPGQDMETFRTSIGTFGLIICYDMFFPELTKGLVLKGADIIVALSASPTTNQHFFETLCLARAIENATPFIFCNYVGPEGELEFWGGSRIVGAKGDIKAQAKVLEEDFVVGDLDPAETEEARFNRPTMRDTRMEAFRLMGEIRKG